MLKQKSNIIKLILIQNIFVASFYICIVPIVFNGIGHYAVSTVFTVIPDGKIYPGSFFLRVPRCNTFYTWLHFYPKDDCLFHQIIILAKLNNENIPKYTHF